MRPGWFGKSSCDSVISECVQVAEAPMLPPKGELWVTESTASATVHLTAPTPPSCPGQFLCEPKHTHTHMHTIDLSSSVVCDYTY